MFSKPNLFVSGVLHEDPPPLWWPSLHEVQRLEAAQHGHSSGRGNISSYLLPGGLWRSQEVLIFILVIFPSQQFYAKLKVTFSVPTDTVSQELTGPGLQVGISET